MCGIAGYFFLDESFSKAARIACKSLAKEMETRGSHSWGTTDGTSVHHALGAISKTLKMPSRLSKDFALHTRFATTGKIKESNSHPFTISGKQLVIGMHNGIIDNHYELNKEYKRTYRVDSQHIFGHIADDVSLNDLVGYGTIVYRTGNEWYIGTFNGGELCIAKTKAGIFFASTHKALASSLQKAGLLGDAVEIMPQDDVIYKVTPSGLTVAYSVRISATMRRWDDSFMFSKYPGVVEDICADCGDVLPLDAITSYCDLCEKFRNKSCEDGWSIEVAGDGESVICSECLGYIRSMESFFLSGNEVMCSECAFAYDIYNEGDK